MTQVIEVGDWIVEPDTGVRGQVVGEGTFWGYRAWPMWKVNMGGGRITLIGKAFAKLWHKKEGE